MRDSGADGVAVVRPLRGVAPGLAALCGLLLLALLAADLTVLLRLALLAAFVVAAAAIARELRRAAAVRTIAWSRDGGWTLDGAGVAVEPSTRVHAALVVLVLRPVGGPGAAGGRRSVHWVPRAAVDPEGFRRLKARLRHGGRAPGGPPPENPP
jgi:hypothetical protein